MAKQKTIIKAGDTVNMDSLRKEHADYKAMSWRWKKMRILLAGEDAVKTWDIQHTRGGPSLQTFILCPPGQEKAHYDFSVYSARFLNLTARTSDVLTGFLFYRPPFIAVPSDMDSMLNNIDLSGTPIEEFAKNVAKEAITLGRGAILVDYPDVSDGQVYTKKMAADNSVRPFVKYYYAEQIFNWEFSVINNVRVLTRVLLDETYDNEEFSDTARTVIRELLLEYSEEHGDWIYRNTLYVEGANAEFIRGDIRARLTGGRKAKEGTVQRTSVPILANGKPLNTLPFQFVAPQYDQVNILKGPLSDVADLNVEHYRKSVEISSALFHCAHPTPIFCGFTFTKGQDVLLGSRQGISTPNESAHASYLELNGQSITEIRKERDAVLIEAASMGARIGASSSKSQNETAEAARLKSSGETSVLYTLTSSLDQIFLKVLGIMAMWMDSDPKEVTVAFNREYMPYRLEGNDINALVNAMKEGTLSYEDFLDILKTGGVMRQSRTLKEYLEGIKETAEARKAFIVDDKKTTTEPVIKAKPDIDLAGTDNDTE